MENVWFVVLVAIVGIIRWALQTAEARKNQQAAGRQEPAPTSPLQRAPTETEEERMRRFFEALGVPKGESPPRKVVTPRPGKKILPVDPFPVPRTAPALPAPVAEPNVVIPPLSPTPAPAPAQTPVSRTPLIVDRAAPAPPVPEFADAPKTGLAARLSNADGLRDAIVLREIFGPPRSMQPLDLTC